MPSRLTIFLHSIISILILVVGMYVLVEQKLVIAGKYVGGVHFINYPGNILIAVASFFAASFMMLVLVDRSKAYIKQICEAVFILALILFIVGVYI